MLQLGGHGGSLPARMMESSGMKGLEWDIATDRLVDREFARKQGNWDRHIQAVAPSRTGGIWSFHYHHQDHLV